jgi:hypothetical protein
VETLLLDCFTAHLCTSADKQTVVNQFCMAIIVARESLASFSYFLEVFPTFTSKVHSAGD